MRKNPPRAEVAEHVASEQRAYARAAVHVATRHGAAEAVVVFGVGIDERVAVVLGRAAARRVEAVRALAESPAVVAAGDDAIHFLPVALADVAGPEIARRAVEAESPGVAKAVCVYLRAFLGARAHAVRAPRIAEPAVVGRDRVIRAARDVDPQELAQELASVLRIILRIAARAAVPERHVQHAVRAESEMSAVVVVERLVDGKQHRLARGGERRSAVGARVRGEHGLKLAVVAGVVQVYASVARELRIEGHAEQASLAAVLDACGNVDELAGGGDRVDVVEGQHATGLLDDEPARIVPRRLDREYWVREGQSGVHTRDLDPGGCRRWRRGHRRAIAAPVAAADVGQREQTEDRRQASHLVDLLTDLNPTTGAQPGCSDP